MPVTQPSTAEPGAVPAARINYHRLSPAARCEITARSWFAPSVTIAGYIRKHFPDGQWGGDSCGCPDDRCIGYHPEPDEDCGCFETKLDEYACGVAGHVWSDEIREADYGRGPVRWRLCTRCTAADYLTVANALSSLLSDQGA